MKTRALLALFLLSVTLACVAPATAAATASPEAAIALHAEYDRLLKRHVQGLGVDYAVWKGSAADADALARYVDELTALDPAGWPREDGLAYWINLYNSVTLRLVLDNYPIDSIKDIGGFLKKSPWKRKLVTVAGRELTLDDIENKIIRPTYGDPRIHFALNCASVGCPPLRAGAYLPELLDGQLDAACKLAMNHDRWVRSDDEGIRLTKIFDWYRSDFEQDAQSLSTFINRYRASKLPPVLRGIKFMPYDWSLNSAEVN